MLPSSLSKRKIATHQDGKVITDYILENCAKHPDEVFLTQPIGSSAAKKSISMCKDSVRTWTFGLFLSESMKMAAHIESLGLAPSSRIAIMSKNCAWWLMADLAIMMTGHVSVPIDPSMTAETTRHMLVQSEAKLLFVGKMNQILWADMKQGIPRDMQCISFPQCPEGLEYDKWNAIIRQTPQIKEVKKRASGELASIVYTGGLTDGKSLEEVKFDFQSLTEPTFALINILQMGKGDRYLSYLPITEGMERWIGECVPFVTGCHLFFANSKSSVRKDVARCKPTVFLSKPRLWEKLREDACKSLSPSKLEKLRKNSISSFMTKKAILKKMGLEDCRYAGCGSDPMSADMLAWFRNLGLEFLEGYGTTKKSHYPYVSKITKGHRKSVSGSQKTLRSSLESVEQ